MQRGGLREPIGGGAKECLVTGVWAPNVGEPLLDINWQPEGRGHGQFGRFRKVRRAKEVAALADIRAAADRRRRWRRNWIRRERRMAGRATRMRPRR